MKSSLHGRSEGNMASKKKTVKKENNFQVKTNMTIKELHESRNGGQIALKGYSYQFLYSCYLMLTATEENISFNLEGIEDIDHIISQIDGNSITHIQLKYSTVKQDASFMSSVMKNFLETYLIDRNRKFKLVYDFSIAKGNLSKLLKDELDDKSKEYWKETIKKIRKETPDWNWDNFNFDDFISKITYQNIKKSSLEDKLECSLIENYDISVNNIKLFVNSIKMFCFDKMENRSLVLLKDIQNCIEKVKFDISKGVQNPAHSWIKKLDFSISSKQEEDYYEGKKATPLDIANGLPIVRTDIENEILESVNKYMVTIIKSSSGQGKTTLALKTQYVLQKEYTPYQITCCNDSCELGAIVEYFYSRTRLGEKPLILLDNLDSHISEWNHLIQLMQTDVKYNYKIILTSRESDWYNYSGDISDIRSVNIIKPILTKEEAIKIYNKFKQVGHIHPNILSWKSAWEKIADKKLLIEYVYLLTHGEMIEDRISAQMKEIGKTKESGIKFEILRKVCFADICGIRISMRKLLLNLSKDMGYDLSEILKSMSDEFLVQISEDNKYIVGLHPVRSYHIVNYLHEYYPIEETAYSVTNLASKQDYSILFSHFPEFKFDDKEEFYSKVVNKHWNLGDLKGFVYAIRGTFSGSVLKYFNENKNLFDDAHKHNGLEILATDICPFSKFKEIEEDIETLRDISNIFPDNENIQYLLDLENRIPKINIIETDIYILCQKLYDKLKKQDIKDILDIDSYSIIADWLYNMDNSMNLALNINIGDLWERAEESKLESISLIMYLCFCGNRNLYENFVNKNLSIILNYLKCKTFSYTLYVNKGENAIYVKYILKQSEIKKGNDESVSRLKNICRMLPIYEKYYSDAITPKLEILEGYKIPDDAHKEMPRKNLIIMFHQEFNSLWIKTIQSNYEFDSIAEWIEYWFNVRKCICENMVKLNMFMYQILGKKQAKKMAIAVDRKREEYQNLLCGILSYPKEYRPFGEVIEIPKKFKKIQQDYFTSIKNFLEQVIGLLKKEEKNTRLALFNLKKAKASLGLMHVFFQNLSLEGEDFKEHLKLCENEIKIIEESYMCCKYYLEHNGDRYFNKFQVKNWYLSKCKREIEKVNLDFIDMKEKYNAIFPIKAYEEEIYKEYPIIFKNFDVTNAEVMQEFIIDAISFADSTFDYLIVSICDEKNYIFPGAIKFSKRLFEFVKEILISGNQDIEVGTSMPYPIDTTEEMIKCFEGNWKLKEKVKNSCIDNIYNIAEELWIYSKIRKLLREEENTMYYIDKLKEVEDKIESMKKEIICHLDTKIIKYVINLCDKVYKGASFGDREFNETIKEIQEKYN